MKEAQDRLINMLLERNTSLSHAQARAWVELLWEDFEATYAKIGQYKGASTTEHVVATWIENHGNRLHEIQTSNPKYKHLLNQDDYLTH